MPVKHRPPHATFKIKELIAVGKHTEAQRCTDENVAWYDFKIGEQQDLFLEAQCSKMGLKQTPENMTGIAAAIPKRRVVLTQ